VNVSAAESASLRGIQLKISLLGNLASLDFIGI